MRAAPWFTAWIIWMMFTALWAPSGARVEQSLEDLFFLGVFVLLAWWFVATLPTEEVSKIFLWAVGAGIVYFFLSMYQGPQTQGRFSVPGGGPNVFARIMILAMFACSYFLIIKRKSLLASIAIPMFAIGAVLSGSRGALLAMGIALLLVFAPMVRRLGFWRLFACLIALIAIGVAVANVTKIDLTSFIEDRYVEQTLEQGYSSGRDQITGDAWSMFVDNPVFGAGLDGYYASQQIPEKFQYPHNLALATLAEGGLIGASLLTATFLSLCRAAIKVRPIPAPAFVSLSAFFFLVAASFTSGDYYDSRYIWLFGAVTSTVALKAKRK